MRSIPTIWGPVFLAAALAVGVGISPRHGGVAQPEGEVVSTDLAAHPMAKMVGLWRGTASRIGRDGQWHEAVGVERAHWNLAGTAILVEGFGYVDDPATGERTVGHDAFGYVEWDGEAKAPAFFAKRAGEGFERHLVELVEDGAKLRWSLEPAPNVSMRFTVSITDTRWHEIGEFSRDGGTTWTKILETDLAKVGPAAAER